MYTKEIMLRHKRLWHNRNFLYSFFSGVVLFALSLFVNKYASNYATTLASNYVQDILLSNIPVFNVNFIVNNVAIMFLVFVIAALVILEAEKIPFVLKTTALFIVIRSIFMMLTHLGTFPSRSYIDPNDLFRSFNIGGDYFFSGHTGLPFLMALIFWNRKWLRLICLIASFIFGASVLLGHLHYSIDVFAAFFITYSIFHIANKFFASDLRFTKWRSLKES